MFIILARSLPKTSPRRSSTSTAAPRITHEPSEALELARRLTPPSALLCVTGSLFLAAEARAIVLKHEAVAAGAGVAT